MNAFAFPKLSLSEQRTPNAFVSKNDYLLEAAQGRSVLHLGCIGFSDFSTADRVQHAKDTLHWKLSQVAEVVGLDYSIGVIEEYRRLGIFSNIVPGNVEELERIPLARKFEVIIAGDIIEHIANPGKMLSGLCRFCTSGTRLIITTPNAFGLPNYVRFLLGKFHEGGEHVMTFNAQNLVNMLHRYGYVAERMATCYQPTSARTKLFALGRKLFETFPQLGGTLLVDARLAE